jgi:hypothetical protein
MCPKCCVCVPFNVAILSHFELLDCSNSTFHQRDVRRFVIIAAGDRWHNAETWKRTQLSLHMLDSSWTLLTLTEFRQWFELYIPNLLNN